MGTTNAPRSPSQYPHPHPPLQKRRQDTFSGTPVTGQTLRWLSQDIMEERW